MNPCHSIHSSRRTDEKVCSHTHIGLVKYDTLYGTKSDLNPAHTIINQIEWAKFNPPHSASGLASLCTAPELYLFDVEEVLGIKGDGGAGHRNILIQGAAVADVGPHSKCHCFSL